ERRAGGLDRPGWGRALVLGGGQRREREGVGEPRHGLRHPPQAGAGEYRGDEGDLDQIEGRVSRRVRELRSGDGVAQAAAETAPADPGGRRLSLFGAPRGPLWRWLDAPGDRQEPD